MAFHQPLQLEGLDLAFAAVHGLIAHAQRKAVAGHLNRAIRAGHVEDDQLVAVVGHDEPRWQWWFAAGLGHGEQGLQRSRRKLMAADCVVVFDAEDQHTAFSVGEARHPTSHLVAHLFAVARFLGIRGAVEQ